MRGNEDPGLVYKTVEDAARPAAVPAEVDGVLSDAVIACIADCIGDLTSGYEKKIADLQTQVAELRGQVSTLLALLGTKADVLPLPGRRSA